MNSTPLGPSTVPSLKSLAARWLATNRRSSTGAYGYIARCTCRWATEISFRLPAVIASSLGAVVVYASLRQATTHRWIALASGMCFVLQSHMLFFGTEARVFGLVILLSCLVCHWFINDRHFWWIVGCSLLAIAIQPVSAPWFGLLSVSAWIHQRLRCNLWQ